MFQPYLLPPCSSVLLEKLTGSAASQEIPLIFGTRKFLTVLTSARHLSLSWANSTQSPQPPPTSWKSILILSSHLHLSLPKWSLSLRFPHQHLYFSPPYALHAPPISFFSIFITRKILVEEYRSLSSSWCSFLHSLVTPSPLGSKILLKTLFSNTLSLRYSLSMSDQVSHPYKTTDKIIALYIVIFKFLDSKLEGKRFKYDATYRRILLLSCEPEIALLSRNILHLVV